MFINNLSLLKNKESSRLTRKGSYTLSSDNEQKNARQAIKKLVTYLNYLFKKGAKMKTLTMFNSVILNLYMFNNLYSGSQLGHISSSSSVLNNFLTKSSEGVSFGGFPLYIRTVQSNRKIRKYSKGKLRYRGYLAKIRTRAEMGLYFRLWKVSVIMNDEVANDTSYLLNSFF